MFLRIMVLQCFLVSLNVHATMADVDLPFVTVAHADINQADINDG